MPATEIEVGDELRGDRRARRDLAVLARVAVVRDDRGDAPRRRAAQRVDHDQELHQVGVRGRARRLEHEAVDAAHVLLDLDADLAVAERARPLPCPTSTSRYGATRAASARFELPVKSFRSCMGGGLRTRT